ncbi:MAG: hypothetical protein ACYDB1_13275 [Acidiferrobacteraceae bacterium]
MNVRPDPALIRGTKDRALWLATLGFFGGFAGVAIFGPLVPRFSAVMHLTPLQGGILAAPCSGFRSARRWTAPEAAGHFSSYSV